MRLVGRDNPPDMARIAPNPRPARRTEPAICIRGVPQHPSQLGHRLAGVALMALQRAEAVESAPIQRCGTEAAIGQITGQLPCANQ
jgi:hypothetical protein